MAHARSQILEQQRIWAANRKIALDPPGYVQTLDANLFKPLHHDTLRDFRRGSGDELGREGKHGKMQALHSSSALVVNFFDYWRGKPLTWIARALSLPSEPSSLTFEAQFRTGLPGIPPNLDLAFILEDQRNVAVESKFTEPYGHTSHSAPFKCKYFPTGNGLWHGYNLPRCQKLAGRLQQGDLQFRHLNAAQLLKHVLGLVRPPCGPFTLFYLWYAVPSEEAILHEKEVEMFADEIGSDLKFCALTYQELFSFALRDLGAEHTEYMSYLEDRYFPTLRAPLKGN